MVGRFIVAGRAAAASRAYASGIRSTRPARSAAALTQRAATYRPSASTPPVLMHRPLRQLPQRRRLQTWRAACRPAVFRPPTCGPVERLRQSSRRGLHVHHRQRRQPDVHRRFDDRRRRQRARHPPVSGLSLINRLHLPKSFQGTAGQRRSPTRGGHQPACAHPRQRQRIRWVRAPANNQHQPLGTGPVSLSTASCRPPRSISRFRLLAGGPSAGVAGKPSSTAGR